MSKSQRHIEAGLQARLSRIIRQDGGLVDTWKKCSMKKLNKKWNSKAYSIAKYKLYYIYGKFKNNWIYVIIFQENESFLTHGFFETFYPPDE